MNKEFGEIQQLGLKTLWSREAEDFTPWLCQNIGYLSNVIGQEIKVLKNEYSLENFRIDILGCLEDDESVKIVIENQFGSSNHDHLGKLLAYMSTVRAKIAVWIVEEAREEHINAINFLNNVSSDYCMFYLIEAKVLKIDNSKPAFILEPVIKPDSDITVGEKSPTSLFWEEFIEMCKQMNCSTYATLKPPTKQNWLNAGCGKRWGAYCISISKQNTYIQLVFNSRDAETNKREFDKISAYREEIDKKIGKKLEYNRKNENINSTIRLWVDKGGYIETGENRKTVIRCTIEAFQHFEGVFKEFLRRKQ